MATKLTGDALLSAIDGEAWHAANRADVAKADPTRRGQAVLLDTAALFWRDIYELLSLGYPLSRNQQFAVNYVASEGRKRTWGQ